MTWAHGARARLRLLARRAAESRIDQIRFHIDMETQRLVQPGRRLEGAVSGPPTARPWSVEVA